MLKSSVYNDISSMSKAVKNDKAFVRQILYSYYAPNDLKNYSTAKASTKDKLNPKVLQLIDGKIDS